MSSSHLQDQEKQILQQNQEQLWKMRWFFILFLAFLAFMSIITSIVVLYIILIKTVVIPLIPLISSGVGLAPSFWLLAQRLTKYLFPMSKREFELAKEKLRYKGEKKMSGKVKDAPEEDKKEDQK